MIYKIGMTVAVIALVAFAAVTFSSQIGLDKVMAASSNEFPTNVGPGEYSGGIGVFYQYTNMPGRQITGKENNPQWALVIFDGFDQSSFRGWVQIYPQSPGEMGEKRVVLKYDNLPPVWEKTFPVGIPPEEIAQAIAQYDG